MKFENKLINLRKSRGISQEQLAEALGVSRQAISRWESGDSTPDMTNLLGLCQYFNVSADYLIFDDRENVKEISNDETTNNASINQKNQTVKNNTLMRVVLPICLLICSIAFAAIALAIFVKLV